MEEADENISKMRDNVEKDSNVDINVDSNVGGNVVTSGNVEINRVCI